MQIRPEQAHKSMGVNKDGGEAQTHRPAPPEGEEILNS